MARDRIFIWRAENPVTGQDLSPAPEKILSRQLGAGRASILTRRDFYLARDEKRSCRVSQAGLAAYQPKPARPALQADRGTEIPKTL